MTMDFDYSTLFKSKDGIEGTWRELYDESSSLAWNLENILRCTILLPYEFYDIITAYFLLPSALCRTVPYLFLFGQSGSGKSTVAKVASYLHGSGINSSSDTFAGIRNDLNARRKGLVKVKDENSYTGDYLKETERNVCMVWDDVDASVFTNSPDIYRLFKFGSNKSTDKIILSSSEVGENLEFHCFCPKIFSSISPLHLDERFKELKRRLIVIPCKRVEDLTDERKAELNLVDGAWQDKILDLDTYDWSGFETNFRGEWDLEQAGIFIKMRDLLGQSVKGLTSQQRSMSLDLMATGITTNVWEDEIQALERIKAYWAWFKTETEKNSELGSLLRDYIKQETKNARNGGRPLEIYTTELRGQISIWLDQGWLYEKPKSGQVKAARLDLGMRQGRGKWTKG